MSRTALSILTLLTALILTLEAQAGTVITRMSDRQSVTFSQLVADVGSSELILIGESHDNKSHHDIQLAVIRSLWAKKLPLTIGLEMMQSDSQPQLDAWIEGKMSEESFQMAFAQNWSDWQMYREIFVFARDNHIPMIALNVPKELVKKVAHQGWDSLTPEERRDLPAGVSCDLNNPHTAFLKRTFKEMFQHLPNKNIFTYFCEAQTLRNSGMALQIARYLKKHPERKVVGLTGIWHAIKNAIPEQLERNGSKLPCTVILPEIPEITTGATVAGEADYLIAL